MSKIRLGILGGGGDSLIGIVHRIASGMFDEFDLVGGLTILRYIPQMVKKHFWELFIH